MSIRAMSGDSPRLARSGLLLVVALAGFVALAAGPITNPPSVAAAKASRMESKILRWINEARADRGLPKLRSGDKLKNLAGDRAKDMASTGEMEHAGCLSCLLNSSDVSWKRCGEVIAYTTWPWGKEAARSIFRGWKHSKDHWKLLMGPRYKRIGIGVAYRSSEGQTFGAAVLVG